jgi:hypothetical protein
MKELDSIPDEELEQDILDTRQELAAYEMILGGFRLLQKIPTVHSLPYYRIEIMRYESDVVQCKILLENLLEVQKSRKSKG